MMNKKIRFKILSLLLAVVFMMPFMVFKSGITVYAASEGPELLVTELMPYSNSADDAYEYIELYNNTNNNIDIKDYKLANPYFDFSTSKIIPPKGILVICTRNNTNLQNFNSFYGTALTDDKYTVLPYNNETMSNNSQQSIILAKDDGTVITMAGYNVGDFEMKKSITYKYPQTGFDMVKLAQKQIPTPGLVSAEQIPAEGVRVTGITLDKALINLEINQTAAIAATVLPSTAANKSVTWLSSNIQIAEVNQNGIVTAKSEGIAVITARTIDGGFSSACAIAVKRIPVTGITLDKTSIAIDIGKAVALFPNIIPANSTNKLVTWVSSNSSIATVDGNGVVVGRNQGTAVISVKTVDGNFVATCTVTVNNINTNVPVTGVTLNKTSMNLDINKVVILESHVLPDNATNKQVTWSSNNADAATVDSNGIITTKAPGVALISVRTVEGGYTSSCLVVVNNINNGNIPVTGVKLDKAVMEMQIGTAGKLAETVYPANATNKSVVWVSDNPSVAVVDGNGNVTAVKEGTAVVTVRTNDGSFNDKSIVIVQKNSNVAVTGIKLNKNAMLIQKDQRVKLVATVYPIDAANKAIKWATSNPSAAYVSDNGEVIGLGEGTAVISATTVEGNLTDNCYVTVIKKENRVTRVAGVRINKSIINVEVGKAEKLTAIITPGSADNKSVRWVSSNKNVAYVGSDGRVVGVNSGRAIITVFSNDGNYKAMTIVNVIDKKGNKKDKNNKSNKGNKGNKGNGRGK